MGEGGRRWVVGGGGGGKGKREEKGRGKEGMLGDRAQGRALR